MMQSDSSSYNYAPVAPPQPIDSTHTFAMQKPHHQYLHYDHVTTRKSSQKNRDSSATKQSQGNAAGQPSSLTSFLQASTAKARQTTSKPDAEVPTANLPSQLPLTAIVNGARVPLTEATLVNMKVPTLKILVQQFCLKSGGKKMQLIERILDYASKIQNPSLQTSKSSMRTPNAARHEVAVIRTEASQRNHTKSQATMETTKNHPIQPPRFFPFQPNHPAAAVALRSCLCVGAAAQWPGPAISCTSCSVRLHEVCMKWDPALADNSQFLCPLCRMQNMDPFYPPLQLLWFNYYHRNQPGTTIMTNPDGDATCVIPSFFRLIAPQLHAWRRGNQEVQVRCVRLGTTNGFTHEWPRTLDLKIHDSVESVFAPRPDHKRRDCPMTITQFLKPDINPIEIFASELLEDCGAYALGIFLCATMDVSQLVEQVKAETNESYGTHFQRVLQIVADDSREDDEVTCVEKSRKLKLSCPITLSKMIIPARGRACQHLQCFDLESFIAVTKQSKAFNNRWKCPECTLTLRPQDLVVDHYVSNVLVQSPTADVIEVAKDGTWSIIQVENNQTHYESDEDTGTVAAQHAWKNNLITIEDIDDDSEDENNSSHPTTYSSAPQQDNVIDLSPTSSSNVELTDVEDDQRTLLKKPSKSSQLPMLAVEKTLADETWLNRTDLSLGCSDLRRANTKRPREDEGDGPSNNSSGKGNSSNSSHGSSRYKRVQVSNGNLEGSEHANGPPPTSSCCSLESSNIITPEMAALLLMGTNSSLEILPDSQNISDNTSSFEETQCEKRSDTSAMVGEISSTDWLPSDFIDLVIGNSNLDLSSSIYEDESEFMNSTKSRSSTKRSERFWPLPRPRTSELISDTIVDVNNNSLLHLDLDAEFPSTDSPSSTKMSTICPETLSIPSIDVQLGSDDILFPTDNPPVTLQSSRTEQHRHTTINKCASKLFVPIAGAPRTESTTEANSLLAAAALWNMVENLPCPSSPDTPQNGTALQELSPMKINEPESDEGWLPIAFPPRQSNDKQTQVHRIGMTVE